MRLVILLTLTLLPLISLGDEVSLQERSQIVERKTLAYGGAVEFMRTFNQSELDLSIIDFTLDPSDQNHLKATFFGGQQASVFLPSGLGYVLGWAVGPAVAGVIEMPKQSSFLGISRTSFEKHWMHYRGKRIVIGEEFKPAQ